jgi:hypothetical protein
MWGHYRFRMMGIFLRPLNNALSSTIDIFWWYRDFLKGKLCPICFSKKLGFGGSIFVH